MSPPRPGNDKPGHWRELVLHGQRHRGALLRQRGAGVDGLTGRAQAWWFWRQILGAPKSRG